MSEETTQAVEPKVETTEVQETNAPIEIWQNIKIRNITGIKKLIFLLGI